MRRTSFLKLCFALAVCCTSAIQALAAILVTDGSQTSVQSVIYGRAADGDLILLPPGTFVWGTSASRLYITKKIILMGYGTNTVIRLAEDGPTAGNGVITLQTNAVVSNFSIVAGTNGAAVTAFTATCNGFRINRITYLSTNYAGYFLYSAAYGLVDNCDITGGSGSQELIFARGPTDSWQTPSSLGTTNALYIEGNSFHGAGYICDINANGRGVVRFNTTDGMLKVDGHGKASNTPARGVRHMEVYGNVWTNTDKYWTTIELRGGTGYVFANSVPLVNGAYARFYLTDYGYTALWSNFGRVYQTPLNYPVDDQIGVGMDPKVAGSEPMYVWNNTALGSADWLLDWKAVPQAAINLYGTQIGDTNVTYAMTNVIQADIDYFKGTVGAKFDGSTGIGCGTKADMMAITPSKPGVGFWVTDEGTWNTATTNVYSGTLYSWNGTKWTSKYTPLHYPHPLAVALPVIDKILVPPPRPGTPYVVTNFVKTNG